MELDDLKASWRQTTDTPQISNDKIMDIIHNKKYGPVAYLRLRFRKQVITLTLAIIFISLFLMQRLNNPFIRGLFSFYLFTWLITCIYFIYNYRIISSVFQMDVMIKERVSVAIGKLEASLKWRLWFIMFTMFMFVIYLEIWMRYFPESGMDSWLHQYFIIRLLAYAIFLAIFYFFAKGMLYIKYGKHIRYLKDLVRQMQ